jgi:hypothetical protein
VDAAAVAVLVVALALLALNAAQLVALRADRRRREDGHPFAPGRTLLVHTRRPDDQSIRGVVAAVYDDVIVLDAAAYLEPDGTLQALEGRVPILREHVAFAQQLTPVTPVLRPAALREAA